MSNQRLYIRLSGDFSHDAFLLAYTSVRMHVFLRWLDICAT